MGGDSQVGCPLGGYHLPAHSSAIHKPHCGVLGTYVEETPSIGYSLGTAVLGCAIAHKVTGPEGECLDPRL